LTLIVVGTLIQLGLAVLGWAGSRPSFPTRRSSLWRSHSLRWLARLFLPAEI
jgi:hypothetical protein